MPWQEVTAMAARREFCALAEREEANASALCRRFGISRKTGYKWLARWRTGGDAGLRDRSRQPHTSPARTDAAREARVLALRAEHPAWGGRKLRRRRQDLGIASVPAASTCPAILRRHGRLDPAATPKHTAWQRFAHPAPNDLWQMDSKGEVPLAEGLCPPLLVLDDHSRFAVGLVACANEQATTVQTALTALFRRYGLPWGTPVGPLTILTAWLVRLGSGIRHGHPSHPQTQGKAERYGRTLGAEVMARTDRRDLAGAQATFDHGREVDNLQRPHEALALATPASRYVVSPRPFPDELPPIGDEPDDVVRRGQASGTIDFRGRTWFVSEAVRGQPVALRPTAVDGVVEVSFCPARVRDLDLDAPEEG